MIYIAAIMIVAGAIFAGIGTARYDDARKSAGSSQSSFSARRYGRLDFICGALFFGCGAASFIVNRAFFSCIALIICTLFACASQLASHFGEHRSQPARRHVRI